MDMRAPFIEFGQRPGTAVIPMQWGTHVERFFDPVFSSTMPLEWTEFSAVIDEMNAVCNAALPRWKRRVPFLLTPIGFFTFALGGFLMVQTADFNGPNPVAFVVIALGFILFASGPLLIMKWVGPQTQRMLQDLRRKLSELNARFAQRGIDFQLHESRHLELYRTALTNHRHSSTTGVTTVRDYTLVVQVLSAAGDHCIPASDVLAEQALRGLSPSAPPCV